MVLDGVDLTDRLARRLLDLSPRRDVTLQVAIGWRDSGLFDKGTFIVDDEER